MKEASYSGGSSMKKPVLINQWQRFRTRSQTRLTSVQGQFVNTVPFIRQKWMNDMNVVIYRSKSIRPRMQASMSGYYSLSKLLFEYFQNRRSDTPVWLYSALEASYRQRVAYLVYQEADWTSRIKRVQKMYSPRAKVSSLMPTFSTRRSRTARVSPEIRTSGDTWNLAASVLRKLINSCGFIIFESANLLVFTPWTLRCRNMYAPQFTQLNEFGLLPNSWKHRQMSIPLLIYSLMKSPNQIYSLLDAIYSNSHFL